MKIFDGARYVSVRLKNGATAKLAHGEDFVKYLEMRKGKIEFEHEFKGDTFDVIGETVNLIDRISKNAAEEVNEIKLLSESENFKIDMYM